MTTKTQALVLDGGDNVATMLADGKKGETVELKGAPGTVILADDIPYGHKTALKTIGEGDEIVKYGHRIGIATGTITGGGWVHLHNMSSAVDITFKKRIDSCTTNQ